MYPDLSLDTIRPSINKFEQLIDVTGKELRMNSYRAENWLAGPGRKPMTPAQMVRFYSRTEGHRPGRKDRLSAALGEAFIALGQRIKSKNIAEAQA